MFHRVHALRLVILASCLRSFVRTSLLRMPMLMTRSYICNSDYRVLGALRAIARRTDRQHFARSARQARITSRGKDKYIARYQSIVLAPPTFTK